MLLLLPLHWAIALRHQRPDNICWRTEPSLLASRAVTALSAVLPRMSSSASTHAHPVFQVINQTYTLADSGGDASATRYPTECRSPQLTIITRRLVQHEFGAGEQAHASPHSEQMVNRCVRHVVAVLPAIHARHQFIYNNMRWRGRTRLCNATLVCVGGWMPAGWRRRRCPQTLFGWWYSPLYPAYNYCH